MKVQGCYQTVHVCIHAHSEVCDSAFSSALHVLVTFLLTRAALPFRERGEWQRTGADHVLCFNEATQGGLLWSGLS